MKNIIKYIFIILLTVINLNSCSDVESDFKGEFGTDKYFKNRDQAYASLVATYDFLRKNSGGFENMIAMMNAGSDDNYAGGGNATDGAGIQGFSDYTINANKMPSSFWSDHYQGIAKANILLSKLPNIPMDNTEKARFTAETKTLRALYYFNLVRMFKNVPLILQPINPTDNFYNFEQVTSNVTYNQIEKDLIESINDLPLNLPSYESARLTQGAAKALLGKVYLYQGKNTLASAQFADVNGTPGGANIYGYKLLPKFSDLWVVANKFNSEAIIEVAHSSAGNSIWDNWGTGSDEGNTLCQMIGPRSYSVSGVNSTAPILPSGWAFNIFTQNFYDFIKNDPRFQATVFDAKALKNAGEISYSGAYQDTGYFLNKFLPRQQDISNGGGVTSLNYQQDTYIIRLADTYLMEAEALNATGSRAQALLDAVRARVGLASIPVSMQAIKNERRAELAGEGHRWFDLVRWGDAPTVLANRGFIAGKNEIFPIPYKELENTKIKQNPNY